MANLFGRTARLQISSTVPAIGASVTNWIEVTGLRMSFTVKRTLKPDANSASVEVFNLSATSRAGIKRKGVRVILEAGYADVGLETVIQGDCRLASHEQSGTEWVTRFELLDGGRVLRYGRASTSYAPGTPLSKAVGDLAGKLGLSGGQLAKQLPALSAKTINGIVAHGSVPETLDKLLKPQGYSWSIQDGKLQVLKGDSDHTELIPLISTDSGLIGSPKLLTPDKNEGRSLLSFTSLLNARIRPGCLVSVQSKQFSGQFRVETVTHKGDTHGTDWTSEVEAIL